MEGVINMIGFFILLQIIIIYLLYVGKKNIGCCKMIVVFFFEYLIGVLLHILVLVSDYYLFDNYFITPIEIGPFDCKDEACLGYGAIVLLALTLFFILYLLIMEIFISIYILISQRINSNYISKSIFIVCDLMILVIFVNFVDYSIKL
eukprot:TRINITY_DN2216_c0_g1_i1.p1 TRINITY_DN2216_c0_g1~~TRINITY_DN2216_c0_g1_i1.p1  ORF type:complete len:148 (+),score=8.95 TRINITY_DN2216_c0_g1_i1:81-524(+)